MLMCRESLDVGLNWYSFQLLFWLYSFLLFCNTKSHFRLFQTI